MVDMRLSFVIPAYNEEKYIGDCLKTIIDQKNNATCEVEIIVVNNASSDRTADIVSKYPDVKLVNEPRKGIVHARRAGYLASTGDLIAHVDSDSRLTPNWINQVVDAFSKDEKLIAFSGPVIYYDLSSYMNALVRIFYCIGFVSYVVNRFVFRIGSLLQGGNFVVRRSALDKIGGYDTTIEFYGEDADLARRLNKVGRVEFTFKLPMYSSGRRIQKEGAIKSAGLYGLNYFHTLFSGKPYTKTHKDIRS